IRLVDLNIGRVSTPYGSLGYGTTDGSPPLASFHGISGLAQNKVTGKLMTSEMFGQIVRNVDLDGTAHTLAGESTNQHHAQLLGLPGADGTGLDAKFTNPGGLVVDASGTAYVLDQAEFHDPAGLGKLRRIGSDGRVDTLRTDIPPTASNLPTLQFADLAQ